MATLREVLEAAERSHVAVGHFNFSDLVTLRAVATAARELVAPVMVGVSEGERAFLGVRQAAAAVKTCREEFGLPLFLNADHTHSLEKAEEAARNGFERSSSTAPSCRSRRTSSRRDEPWRRSSRSTPRSWSKGRSVTSEPPRRFSTKFPRASVRSPPRKKRDSSSPRPEWMSWPRPSETCTDSFTAWFRAERRSGWISPGSRSSKRRRESS